MSIAENAAIIRRLGEEFWNAGATDVLDDIVAAGFVDHTPLPGAAGNAADPRQTLIRASRSMQPVLSTSRIQNPHELAERQNAS